MTPEIKPLKFKFLEPEQIKKIEGRLENFCKSHFHRILAPLFNLLEDDDTPKKLRGLVFQLSENLGLLSRNLLVQVPKKISIDEKDFLKQHQIALSRHAVWQSTLMDRKAAKLKALLWSTFHEAEKQNPPVGQQRLLMVDPTFDEGLYSAMGYLLLGAKKERVAVQSNFLPRLEKKIAKLSDARATEFSAVLSAFTNGDGETSLLVCKALGFREVQEDGGRVLSKIATRAKPNRTRNKKAKRKAGSTSIHRLSPFAGLSELKSKLEQA